MVILLNTAGKMYNSQLHLSMQSITSLYCFIGYPAGGTYQNGHCSWYSGEVISRTEELDWSRYTPFYPWLRRYARVYHTVSCCVTLSHVVPHCLMLCHTVSCCVTLSNVVSHCLMLCHTVSCCATLSHVVSHCLMLCHTVSCCATLSNVVSHFLMLCHIVSCCATLSHVVSHCRHSWSDH